MTKRILGLDPGIALLGFGVVAWEPPEAIPAGNSLQAQRQAWDNGQPVQLLDFGVIETSAKTPVGDRLCTIYEDLHALIDEVQPDLVAIEKLFFYRMSNTITVAQARGVLMLVVAQKKLSYREFTPAQIKQALTGYGNADKQAVQLAVARELALETLPKPDDAADALAVALTACFQE